MVGESDQNVFLIQTDASSFAKFEISEFEISRVDCIVPISYKMLNLMHHIAISAITSSMLNEAVLFHALLTLLLRIYNSV